MPSRFEEAPDLAKCRSCPALPRARELDQVAAPQPLPAPSAQEPAISVFDQIDHIDARENKRKVRLFESLLIANKKAVYERLRKNLLEFSKKKSPTFPEAGLPASADY